MKIAVASGKGGTGKTTVAVNLALSLAGPDISTASAESRPILFLDCDVEEPNAYLFLNPDIDIREEVGVPTPVVDETKCTHCGRCAEVCEFHALAVLADQVLVFSNLCHGCGSCLLNCPVQAISEVMRPTGIVEMGWAGDIRFVHGIMNVGEAMPVPVIRRVKATIDSVGPQCLVIIDAPPGTACPMVESVKGVDYVLMITEPTPFGLHDLRLAVDVVKGELDIPVGVVVNRDGLGYGGIDDYCKSANVPILSRIPLDRRIAAACADGQPFFDSIPEYRDLLRRLYADIASEVNV